MMSLVWNLSFVGGECGRERGGGECGGGTGAVALERAKGDRAGDMGVTDMTDGAAE
jgi:hypothetical protein